MFDFISKRAFTKCINNKNNLSFERARNFKYFEVDKNSKADNHEEMGTYYIEAF